MTSRQEHSPRRVVHITTVHRPFDRRIFDKECVSLAEAGYEVTLVAKGDSAANVRGVRIVGLGAAPTSRMRRASLFAFRALRTALKLKADIYHFHDPELIWIGVALKLLGKRVVYDAHELLELSADRPLPPWIKGFVRFGLLVFEKAAEWSFDAIVVATPTVGDQFARKDKVVLVRNTARVEEFAASATPFRDRPKTIIYAGGLAPYNGVIQMFDAMAAIPESVGARLVLAGLFNSPEYEASAFARPGAKYVDFVGWMERDELIRRLGEARAGFVVYQATPNVLKADPVKFYELMGAGLPIVAANIPRWGEIIEAHDCGILVDPSDVEEIARAAERLVSDPEYAEAMGRRGREAALAHYNWSIDERRLLDLYERLIGPGSKDRARSPATEEAG